MKSLAVRLLLLAVFVAAGSLAAYFVWTSESQLRRAVDDVRAFDRAALDAQRGVFEMRSAEQAYVAAGQATQPWITKVAAALDTVKDRLEFLRTHAISSGAQSAVDNATSALQDFEQIDHRSRDYVRNGQPLLAADVIFSDGFESTSAIWGSIEGARKAETELHDSEHVSTRRAEAVAIGAATLVALVTIAMFFPGVAPVASNQVDVSAAPVSLKLTPSSTSSNDASRRVVRARTTKESQTTASIDFNNVAGICADLAKVVDTRALPPLLERAAAILDAPGIVLWIADPDGRELSPIVTHGYPPPIVLRLGTILRDAENATAAALRTSLLQTVDTDSVSNGAIAAPLVTPAGCVGIMAAEVRHHGEKDPAKLATASIIAAQLATLVGPPSTRAQARADAV
jgi:hypothetical protein